MTGLSGKIRLEAPVVFVLLSPLLSLFRGKNALPDTLTGDLKK